jgi:predicted MFS family arabinose efflux permease
VHAQKFNAARGLTFGPMLGYLFGWRLRTSATALMAVHGFAFDCLNDRPDHS